MTEITEKEERIMFHTLGYDYQPRWNDNKGGYRNWFGIYPREDDKDYISIKSLVKKKDICRKTEWLLGKKKYILSQTLVKIM